MKIARSDLKVLAVILLLVALVLLAIPWVTAKADEKNYFSVSIGNTQFKQNDLGSGTWHQAPEYGTAFFPDSKGHQFIFGRQVKPWLGVEFGLRDFGRSEIYGKWITDHGYQNGNIGKEPFDTGFTSSRLRAYSAGVNLSAKVIFDWFLRAHVMRYEWDFQYYNTSGYSPKDVSLGTWKCKVRGFDPLYSVGVRFGNFTIEQTRFNVQHARASDSCTNNFTGGKTVFIGYEWRF